MQLALGHDEFLNAISPSKEMAAYEALWLEPKASFKSIADKFRKAPGALPSDLVPESRISEIEEALQAVLARGDVGRVGVRLNGAAAYPERLRDADHPLEVFYFQGWWDLVCTPAVAVVGARKASPEGILRTKKLVRALVESGYTVVSGLAEGVDTAAHEEAIRVGGQTIAVLGTPLSLSQMYPKANRTLFERIRHDYLAISQVPFQRYEREDYRVNRSFFPARNVTMSALTDATIIVEASDTSGTLYQARAALKQGRKLFVLESCFHNPAITWPARYAKQGAIRVESFDDIQAHLDRETKTLPH